MELKKLLTVSACLILSASCSRKKETSNLTIQLPTFTTASHQISGKAGDVSASADGPPDWNTSLNPASSSDVNCYAVFVGGPEQNLKANKCFDFNAASGVVDPTSIFRFGPHVGFIPAGGSVEVEVPSGSGRIVHLIGVKAQNGACTSFLGGGEPDFTNLSEPHVISRQVVDLAPGDVNLTMVAKIDANTKTFTECDFIKDSGGSGSGPILGKYGNGVESKTVNASGTTVDGTTGQFCDGGSECGAYERISAIAPNGSNTDLTLATVGDFTAGDEVLAIVMDAFDHDGPHGPDSYCANASGDAFVGAHSYHTIQAISGSTVTVSGTSNMLSSIVSANLATRPGPGASYCYVQLVKVVNVNNLTLTGGIVLTAPPLDLGSDAGGGIIAIRVKDTLSIDSGSVITVAEKGFSGGVTDSNALGAVAGVAGSYDASGGGGGGGGHMGPTAFGPTSGGDTGGIAGSGGGAVDSNCSANSNECDEFGKLVSGGGGAGGNAGSGKNGGGIAIIHAKNVSTLSTATIDASGGSFSGPDPSSGAGAGAGGFIEFFSESISGGGTLELKASGGQGQEATAASNNGGGGGAGGFIAIGDAVSCSGDLTLDFSAGAGGASGGGVVGGSGQPGAFTKSFPCP